MFYSVEKHLESNVIIEECILCEQLTCWCFILSSSVFWHQNKSIDLPCVITCRRFASGSFVPKTALPFGRSLHACKLMLWHSLISHRATWPFPAPNHSWWPPRFRAPAAAFCLCQHLYQSWRAFRFDCSFAPGTLMACCCPVHWSLLRTLVTWFCRSVVAVSISHTRRQHWRCQKCQLVRRAALFFLI